MRGRWRTVCAGLWRSFLERDQMRPCFMNFSRPTRAERENRRSRGKIPFLAGALIALGAGWIGFPYAIYKSRPQPVDFSHKVHADKAGAKCEDCHAFREDGTFAGIPTLDKCAGCHAAAMGTTPAEKNFIDRYVTPQPRAAMGGLRAPAGKRLLFAQRRTSSWAGLKCERCHGARARAIPCGPTGRTASAAIRATSGGCGTDHGMKMDDCVACHRQQGLEHSCLDCHK